MSENTTSPDEEQANTVAPVSKPHQSIGTVKEANVRLDDGGPELARVVLVTESETVSFLMHKEAAHDFALGLSPDVVDVDEVTEFA